MKAKKPKYEKPVKIRWLNGVPLGGTQTATKEEYLERMMEYDKTIKRRKKNENS